MKLQFGATTKLQNEKISMGALLATLYFICMPLSIVPLPGGSSLLKYISIFVGGLLVCILFTGKTRLKFNSIHFLLAIYLLYTIGSLFLSKSEGAIVILRGTIETSAIFFLITLKVYNKKESELLMYSWVIVGLITTAIMLMGSVGLEEGSGRVTMGIGGGNEDPNQLCGYFILPILFCLEKINFKNKFKLFYFLLFVGMMFVVFRTGSRGGLISILAAVLVYTFFALRTSTVNKIKMLIGMIIIALVFSLFLVQTLPEDVRERLSINSLEEDQGSGRLQLWTITIDAIKQSEKGMIFGYGLGSTAVFFANAFSGHGVAHNHWLQLWCDQGLIGMLLFFSIFAVGIICKFKRNPVISISLFGMLVLSMTLTMYAYYKPFWNILMMACMNFPYNDELGKGGLHEYN